MWRGHGSSKAQFSFSHHFLSRVYHETSSWHWSSIFIARDMKGSVLESVWLVDSTADLTPVLHHSAAGKDTGPPDVAAPLKVGERERKWTLPKTGLPLWKSRALPWYSSVTMGRGGGVSEAHAHFPPKPSSWFYCLQFTGRCVREASEAKKESRVQKCFSCARDSLMDISNFASNDA